MRLRDCRNDYIDPTPQSLNLKWYNFESIDYAW